jgi:hypothetical protein
MKLTYIILISTALGNAISVSLSGAVRDNRFGVSTHIDGNSARSHVSTKRGDSLEGSSLIVSAPKDTVTAAPHHNNKRRDDSSAVPVPDDHALAHHQHDGKRGDSPRTFFSEYHAAAHPHIKRDYRWATTGGAYGDNNFCNGTTFRKSPSSEVIRYSDCLEIASWYRDNHGTFTVWNPDPGAPDSLNVLSLTGSCTFAVGIAPGKDIGSETPREMYIGSDDLSDLIYDAVARFGGAEYDWVSAQGVVQCDVFVNSTGGDGRLNKEQASMYWSLQHTSDDFSLYVTAPGFATKA